MSKLMNKLRMKALKALVNEKGETNLIAIILILAVVIALVVIFKDELGDLWNSIWGSVEEDVGTALK